MKVEDVSELTKAVKKRITADWLQMFPGLAQYEPMHLLRRVGPIVEGIVLERTSSNDEYRPAFHVHSLLYAYPAVSLTMEQPLLREATRAPISVSVLRHPTFYVEAATTLSRQSPLSLEGDLRLSDVIHAYRQFSERSGLHYDAHQLYRDMVMICAWCGSDERARALVDEGLVKLGAWPANILEQVGGRERWRERMLTAIAQPSALRETMKSQLQALKLSSLPVAQLICDADISEQREQSEIGSD